MSIQKRFTDQELEKIKTAVHDAESKISGEIVPVFVEKSDSYLMALYRAALLMSGIVFLLIIFFDRYLPALAVYDPLMIFVYVLLGGLVGMLKAKYIPFVKRLMLSRQAMDWATRKKAENAFLSEEVFNTRHRTGIMIFVSFFEREVMVMADRGISKVVDQKEWDSLVRGIIENIRKEKVTEGMVAAIHRCGEILLEKGFLKTADDVNELRDDLRMDDK